MAKSTIMMPFFLTMPISRMTPISAITLKSKSEHHQHQQRADAGRWQSRKDRQRMDVALIEHAEDEVDDDDCGGDEQWLARERILERLRIALECPGERSGNADLAPSPARSRSRPAPSATPGARLKLKVTAGNCPWWLIDRNVVGAGRPFHQRAQRHLLAGERRLDVNVVERLRSILQLAAAPP